MSVIVYKGKDGMGKQYYVAVDTDKMGDGTAMQKGKEAMAKVGVLQYDMKVFREKNELEIRNWIDICQKRDGLIRV